MQTGKLIINVKSPNHKPINKNGKNINVSVIATAMAVIIKIAAIVPNIDDTIVKHFISLPILP